MKMRCTPNPQSGDIERFFDLRLKPALYQPWVGQGAGTLQIVSQVVSGAPFPYTYLDQTMKALKVTIESLENREFQIAPEDVRAYPDPGAPLLYDLSSNDGSNVFCCVKSILLLTWKSTGHGRLSIRSKRHRNGKIEVLVGETTSYRFFVDPDKIIH
jgi:hypothetical protein